MAAVVLVLFTVLNVGATSVALAGFPAGLHWQLFVINQTLVCVLTFQLARLTRRKE